MAIKVKAGYDWTPRRRGQGTKLDLYCSPACGTMYTPSRGCTFKAYQDAVKAGDRLAKRLGPAWKPRIWENMGWFYSAELVERLSVREYAKNKYSIYGYRGGVINAASLRLVLRHLKRIIQADIRDAMELLKEIA